MAPLRQGPASPIGIGSLAGGWLGGRLMHHYGEVVGHPAQVWWAFTGIGIGTTALMRIYHSFVQTNLPTAEANRTI